MVLGCKGRHNLPILADWLEERLGLSATATLLRSLDLQPLSGTLDNCREFDYFSLGPDVFLWLASGSFSRNGVGFQSYGCVVVGLYAHPPERPKDWTKVASMVALEEDGRDPQRPWQHRFKKHPLVEAARTELAGFVGQAGNE